MAHLFRYTTTYGDGKTVVYWRPADAEDEASHQRANELNELDEDDELGDYNAACAAGTAGPVATIVEEVDE